VRVGVARPCAGDRTASCHARERWCRRERPPRSCGAVECERVSGARHDACARCALRSQSHAAPPAPGGTFFSRDLRICLHGRCAEGVRVNRCPLVRAVLATAYPLVSSSAAFQSDALPRPLRRGVLRRTFSRETFSRETFFGDVGIGAFVGWSARERKRRWVRVDFSLKSLDGIWVVRRRGIENHIFSIARNGCARVSRTFGDSLRFVRFARVIMRESANQSARNHRARCRR